MYAFVAQINLSIIVFGMELSNCSLHASYFVNCQSDQYVQTFAAIDSLGTKAHAHTPGRFTICCTNTVVVTFTLTLITIITKRTVCKIVALIKNWSCKGIILAITCFKRLFHLTTAFNPSRTSLLHKSIPSSNVYATSGHTKNRSQQTVLMIDYL